MEQYTSDGYMVHCFDLATNFSLALFKADTIIGNQWENTLVEKIRPFGRPRSIVCSSATTNILKRMTSSFIVEEVNNSIHPIYDLIEKNRWADKMYLLDVQTTFNETYETKVNKESPYELVFGRKAFKP
uniref:Uncharacterized protein n=3 Tax=Clytia hemisphaerica TaxID=252671 RepID=A0A7M6DM17_9CNID